MHSDEYMRQLAEDTRRYTTALRLGIMQVGRLPSYNAVFELVCTINWLTECDARHGVVYGCCWGFYVERPYTNYLADVWFADENPMPDDHRRGISIVGVDRDNHIRGPVPFMKPMLFTNLWCRRQCYRDTAHRTYDRRQCGTVRPPWRSLDELSALREWCMRNSDDQYLRNSVDWLSWALPPRVLLACAAVAEIMRRPLTAERTKYWGLDAQ